MLGLEAWQILALVGAGLLILAGTAALCVSFVLLRMLFRMFDIFLNWLGHR